MSRRTMDDDMDIVDENGESLSLDDRYTTVPLDALRVSARVKIALYLDNTCDIIDEDIGYVTDWNGLAELIGFSNLEMKKFGRQKSPTKDLMEDWSCTPDLNYKPTLGNLWKLLIELGRIDVIQDCRNIVIKDAENYIVTKERLANDYLPVQDGAISQSTAPDHYVDETAMLVTSDIDGSTTLFDAFISYNADNAGKDIMFVKEMIDKLEKQYNLKLCVPGRDDLPGGSRYVTYAKLIESRCRRMIIVLSHEYIHSSACDFQVKFAHALAPGARSKKLIPVLIEPNVQIPQILRHVTLCDYTKHDLMEWFWERLAKSVKAPLDPEPGRLGSSIESSSSSPISISPSMSQSSVSPSASFSSIGAYRVSNHSLENAQQLLAQGTSSSGDAEESSNADSGNFSYTSGSSMINDDASFQREYVSLSPPDFPSQSSLTASGKKDKGKKLFFGKIFGKKSNSNTSSHA